MEHEKDGLLLRVAEVDRRLRDSLQRAASVADSRRASRWRSPSAWSRSRNWAATSCRRSTKGACRSTCCCRRARRSTTSNRIAGMVDAAARRRSRASSPSAAARAGPNSTSMPKASTSRRSSSASIRNSRPHARRDAGRDPRGAGAGAGRRHRRRAAAAAPDLAHALGRQGAGRHQALRRRPRRAARQGRTR